MLRIDDDLTPGGPNLPAPQYAEQSAPEHLESVYFSDGARPLAGIRSWESAVQFWKQYETVGAIDLVVSDVKFLDETSPLQLIGADGTAVPLPTGLSHFKALASIARARGSRLGVGLHSKDPTIWEELWNDVDPAKRMMALLAAHEIGELAAIMGEADELPQAGLAGCWDWLKRFTIDKPNFHQAIPVALAHYRHGLRAVRVLPSDWQELVKWCGKKMEAGAATTLREGDDPGFSILRDDGSIDAISLRSLFADVPLKPQGFAFDLVGLPRECFALKEDEAFHQLDPNGNPKIGALVFAAGNLARDHDYALKILEIFPIPMNPSSDLNLTTAKSLIGASNLSAALAILLQDIRREYAVFEAWRRLYRDYEWRPESDAFSGEKAHAGRALSSWLYAISNLMRQRTELSDWEVEEFFQDAGVPENDELSGRPGEMRCLKLLCALGVLKQVPGASKYLRGPIDFSMEAVPPLPDVPPARFFDCCGLGNAFSADNRKLNDPSTTLRILFRHDKSKGDAVLGRQIGQAFFGGDNVAGTKFLDAFREGRGDNWIKTLCRSYAVEHLQWRDSSAWPHSIREAG